MATAPPDSLYPPLTADLIHRARDIETAVTLRKPAFVRRSEFAEDAKLFAITWAGGFVFFLMFLG